MENDVLEDCPCKRYVGRFDTLLRKVYCPCIRNRKDYIGNSRRDTWCCCQ